MNTTAELSITENTQTESRVFVQVQVEVTESHSAYTATKELGFENAEDDRLKKPTKQTSTTKPTTNPKYYLDLFLRHLGYTASSLCVHSKHLHTQSKVTKQHIPYLDSLAAVGISCLPLAFQTSNYLMISQAFFVTTRSHNIGITKIFSYLFPWTSPLQSCCPGILWSMTQRWQFIKHWFFHLETDSSFC